MDAKKTSPLVLKEPDDNEKRNSLRATLESFKQLQLPERYFLLGESVDLLNDSYVRTLAELFRRLQRCDFYNLPDEEVSKFTAFADEALRLYRRSESQSISPEERRGIAREAEQLYNTCFMTIAAYIAFWTTNEYDLGELLHYADQSVATIGAKVREAENYFEQVKETVQKATIEKEAVHFQKEAEKHNLSAYGWLAAAIVLSVVTAGFVWNNYNLYAELALNPTAVVAPAITVAQSVQLGLSKLLLFSFLVGGIVWCGRVYRAHRHNYVVNKHRENSLGTFKTFVDSTQDAQTKNAVLLQATQSIFAQQQSGYITQDGEANGHPQVLEIIRNMVTDKDK